MHKEKLLSPHITAHVYECRKPRNPILEIDGSNASLIKERIPERQDSVSRTPLVSTSTRSADFLFAH